MILPKVILKSQDTLVSSVESPLDGFFGFSSGGFLERGVLSYNIVNKLVFCSQQNGRDSSNAASDVDAFTTENSKRRTSAAMAGFILLSWVSNYKTRPYTRHKVLRNTSIRG